jgi:hypothetical protein
MVSNSVLSESMHLIILETKKEMHSRVQINIGEALARVNFNNTSYSRVAKGVLKNIERGISTYNLNFICALESKLQNCYLNLYFKYLFLKN